MIRTHHAIGNGSPPDGERPRSGAGLWVGTFPLIVDGSFELGRPLGDAFLLAEWVKCLLCGLLRFSQSRSCRNGQSSPSDPSSVMATNRGPVRGS
jgi:hypothetical protein